MHDSYILGTRNKEKTLQGSRDVVYKSRVNLKN